MPLGRANTVAILQMRKSAYKKIEEANNISKIIVLSSDFKMEPKLPGPLSNRISTTLLIYHNFESQFLMRNRRIREQCPETKDLEVQRILVLFSGASFLFP